MIPREFLLHTPNTCNYLKSGLSKRCFWQTVILLGVTPAIFVIFVDFRGPTSKIPCFCGQNAISEFSPIFVKTTCFRQGTKRPFTKTTVSTTLIKEIRLNKTQVVNIFVPNGKCTYGQNFLPKQLRKCKCMFGGATNLA